MGTRTAHTVTFCDSSYRGYPGTAPAVGETSARTRFTSRFMTVILESAKSTGIFPLVTHRIVYMWSASQTPPSTIRTISPPPPNYSTICEQKEGARLLPNPFRPTDSGNRVLRLRLVLRALRALRRRSGTNQRPNRPNRLRLLLLRQSLRIEKVFNRNRIGVQPGNRTQKTQLLLGRKPQAFHVLDNRRYRFNHDSHPPLLGI